MSQRTRVPLALSIILIISMAFAFTPAQAAGIVVNTATDTDANDGKCSLREAIIAANTDAAYNGCSAGNGADTITFSGNTTITLGSALPMISKDLTLDGTGQIIVIDGDDTYQILSIDTNEVTLTKLIFQNGYDTTFSGGIYNLSARLTINNSIVRNNEGSIGGGILSLADTQITLNNSTISGNKANLGAGIFNAGFITLNESTISGNRANIGGGILSLGKTILNESTISGNRALDNIGGGIIQDGESLTLNASTVSNNNALYQGGGILAVESNILIQNGSVIKGNRSRNVSSSGGGIFAVDCKITLEDSTLSNNNAGRDGQGIFAYSGTLSVLNSVIDSNGTDPLTTLSSTTDGGDNFSNNETMLATLQSIGIPDLDLLAGDFERQDKAPKEAKGKENSKETTAITRINPLPGGGSYTGDGGGIFITDGTLIVKDSTISNNAVDDEGGGIYSEHSATEALISNTTISGNYSGGGGGGILAYDGLMRIENTIVDNNVSDYGGGGIYMYAGSDTDEMTISHVTVSNNKAYGDYGAGIYAYGNAYEGFITIEYSIITGNINYDEEGGGVTSYGPEMLLTHSQVTDNTAYEDGDGGVGAWGPTTIINTTISGNRAPQSGGSAKNDGAGGLGAFDIYPVILYNVTITDNHGGTVGGISDWGEDAGAGYPSNLQIYNSIIYGNTGSKYNDCDFPLGTVSFKGAPSILGDNTGCTNITDHAKVFATDPELAALADNGGETQTHAIGADSAAVNASGAQATADDQRDIPAVGKRDLGAFEYALILDIASSTPAHNASPKTINSITVTFNKDVVSDGGENAANNPANYLLVEQGANASFDTESCFNGVQTDDTAITIDTATYDSASFTITLGINGGAALPVGTYRLFVCGTTSIYDLNGLELNGGLSDTEIDFTIVVRTASADEPEVLPETGFAPNAVTELDIQPAELAYASTDLVLNIPSLGVSQTIVGVPQSADGWNVSWLGNGVGYLAGTSFPTWAGNTALTGHVWNADGSEGIFANLDQLQHGDQFTIEAWGLTYTYEVRDSEQVYATNLSVLEHSDYDIVTLITCEDFSEYTEAYRYRRAVTAVLVSVK